MDLANQTAARARGAPAGKSRAALRVSTAAPWGAAVVFLLLLAAWPSGSAAGGPAGLVPLWVVNAAVLAAALRCTALLRPLVLIVAFGGTIAAGLGHGMPLPTLLILATANLVEVALAARLLAPAAARNGHFGSIRKLALFFLVAGAIAPLTASAFLLGMLALAGVGEAGAITLHRLLADALGMIVLGPLLMTIGRADLAQLARPRMLAETALILALTAGVTIAVFWRAPFPLLFPILPMLTLAAFRLRFTGTALATATVAAIASYQTLNGSGPIAHEFVSPADQTLLLQAFLAVAVVATLPIASVLADRARLTEQLADSERRFRRLAAAAPVAMFRTDAQGVLTYANAAWIALCGEDDGAPGGTSWLASIAPDDRAAALQRWHGARADGSGFASDLRQHRTGGGTGWTSLTLAAEHDEQGETIGWIGVAVDIDERHRAAARLQHSERRHRLLAENSTDIIARIGLDGVRRYISPACRRILGYAPEDLIGAMPVSDIHPDDRARVERVCRSLLAGAENPVCTYRQRHRDGHYVWLEAAYRLVGNDGSDEPVEIIASVRDVGMRREAEIAAAAAAARLEESNRLLTMAEALGRVGHWRMDAQTRDIVWSDELHRIMGRDPTDPLIYGERVDAYHPEDRPMIEAAIEAALRDGTPWNYQVRLLWPNGEVRYIAATGQAEHAVNGAIIGLFGVAQDITDRKNAEAELIAARDEARAAAEAKAAFLATMSHEIRTPMTGVLGMIELLRADPAPADRDRFFDSLEQSANLLMTVLDDILDFSKIEGRNLILETVDFDLADLARATLDLFHNSASRKGLLLTLSCPVGEIVHVRGDPVRVQQILCNLVSNAIKFTRIGRVELRITLSAQGHRRLVRCEVVDTGVGIEPEDQKRLFEPFVQADASTTRRFGGTGLGLAISRRLVEAMDGRIRVESAPDLGSTFWFEIMLDAGARRIDNRRTSQPPHGRSLSVLVAEDNQVNQALISALVRRDGHRVTCVDNGRLAAQTAQATRFDLILMDMQMPEMDGLAATRAIRTGNGPSADAPIIALTADASIERRRFYDHAGLTEFLTKPVDSAVLASRLAAIAARRDCAGMPPNDEPPAVQDDAPALDEDGLAELEAVIGPAAVDRLLAMLADEARTRPLLIASLIAAGDPRGAAREAHALKGAASGVCARRLANEAAAIEHGTSQGRDLEPLGTALLAAAQATLRSLDDRHHRRSMP